MHRSLFVSVLALLALAAPTLADAAAPRAVVYSKAVTVDGEVEGGLFAVKAGRLNQITGNPYDSEPAFSPDGRAIAFVRDGDLYSIRPDGSGQRHLTSGGALDSAPRVAPNGRFVVFERRAAAEAPADLYRVRALGGGLLALTGGPEDDHQADLSPDGRAIAFVRGDGDGREDIYSMRPSGRRLVRLTRTAAVDEFEPRFFARGIVFSRGESAAGPAAYADIFTMRRDGRRVRPLVRGVGSAYVEDVAPKGGMLLFRRDLGLWSKRIGRGRARKLAVLPDDSRTNGVFSTDGRKVAAFVAADERQSLVAIDVATRRQTSLAAGYEATEKDGTAIGPVIAWQPAPHGGR